MPSRESYCFVCGRKLRWIARRSAWVHASKGQGHAPAPVTPEELAARKPPAAWVRGH